MIRQVRLELARCHEFPEGSKDHGYELSLPLTRAGHLDRENWLKQRNEAATSAGSGRMRRSTVSCTMVATAGYSPSTRRTDGDEIIFKGDEHRFAEGEYVSIKERDGITRTFRVTSVG